MVTKVIFLDVDGVLNDSMTPDRSPAGFIGVDSSKIAHLLRIVNGSGAAIVLTSTWKAEWDEFPENRSEDGQYLNDRLEDMGLTIYDKTMDRTSDRGHGIVRWLEAHPQVTSWVVLDDDRFPDYEECGILPHLVKSVYRFPGGLTKELSDRALEILNR